jgi:hypothetical protein
MFIPLASAARRSTAAADPPLRAAVSGERCPLAMQKRRVFYDLKRNLSTGSLQLCEMDEALALLALITAFAVHDS